jgi:hypothetical protein
MKVEFFRQILEKYSYNKFHENSSSGSRVPCGRTDRWTNRQRDMELTVTFRSSANTPQNQLLQIQEMQNKICRRETWITACFSSYELHEKKVRDIFRNTTIKISQKIYKHLI